VILIKIAGGLVLVFLVVALVVRGRHGSATSTRRETRPSLPPSPYQPSRGFRILDGSEPETPPSVQLPRLDPDKEFVFHDATVTPVEPTHPPHLRHDEQWALDRSMRRAPHPRVRRRRRLTWALVAVLVVVVIVVVAWLLGAHPGHHSSLAVVLSRVPRT